MVELRSSGGRWVGRAGTASRAVRSPGPDTGPEADMAEDGENGIAPEYPPSSGDSGGDRKM